MQCWMSLRSSGGDRHHPRRLWQDVYPVIRQERACNFAKEYLRAGFTEEFISELNLKEWQGVHWIDKGEEAIRGKGRLCKGLKVESTYHLGKTARTVVTMAVGKAISRTAEGHEVTEENQIIKDLVHTTRWFYPLGIENIIKPSF